MIRYIIVLLMFIGGFFPGIVSAADVDYGDIFIVPLDGGWVVTSPYGERVHPIDGDTKFHDGVDIGITDDVVHVLAAADGEVIYSGWMSGYGNAVMIYHPQYNLTTLYGHMAELYISEGWSGTIRQGTKIGLVGSTGNSTGPHLHFEVRNGDPSGGTLPPQNYCSALGDYTGSGSSAQDGDFSNATFDTTYDIGKYLREVIDKFTDACTKGLGLLKDSFRKLFMILITIDLAIGAMFKTLDEKTGDSGLFKWLIFKILFYVILMFLLMNWGTYVGDLSLKLFGGLGGIIGGSDSAAAEKAISDPTLIFQKGMQIITPIYNELLKMHGMTALLNMSSLAISGIFGLVLTACFVIMTIQVALAYLEFYFAILFGFTAFIFAGTKQTRYFGSRGLNMIFSCSLNLMFFCMFSLMLQTTMERISVDAIYTQTAVNGKVEEYAMGANITDVKDYARRCRAVESSNQYDIYNSEGSGAYGAYQQMPQYWDGRCRAYEADHPGVVLHTMDNDCGSSPANAPQTYYLWCSENQDLVSQYQMQCLYDEGGSWRAVADAWNPGGGDAYWHKICGQRDSNVPVTVNNFIVLFKLLLVCLVFIIIGDRLAKSIISQFGGDGFKFTNGQ